MKILRILVPLFFVFPVFAENDDTHYDRISISVERSVDVDNELMIATMAVERERSDPADLAEEINSVMADALAVARNISGVTVETGSYQTYPNYRKSKIIGWRGSQTIILESDDEEKLAALVGNLQQSLVVKSINFSVLDTTRTEYEDQLIGEVLDAFTARADLIRKRLGASGYRIVKINLNNQSYSPRPERRMKAMVMSADAAPIAVQAGTSQVKVVASGSFELLR